jgi:alanine dehydrogenase
VYVFGQARAKIGTGILTNLTIIDRDATRLTVIDREPDSNVQLMVSDHEPITMTLIDKNYS